MNARQLAKLGIPPGTPCRLAQEAAAGAAALNWSRERIRKTLARVAVGPGEFRDDPLFGPLAERLAAESTRAPAVPRPQPAPCRLWGLGFEPQALRQLEDACSLPVAVRGALMPDAHVGYGLPIGGVLATADSVIPYAVGMDIACRMHLTVLRDPCERLTDEPTRFETALRKGTRFGVGSTWTPRQEHPVMDMDWGVSPVTRAGRDLAWSQLGTSGSGNHFAEFGLLTITESAPELPAAGQYLALLTHSGSRGVGAQVATHYSRVAEGMHPELRPELRRLAWLGLDTHAGQEYWKAMELMGVYAAANHEIIHREVLRLLGSSALYTLENHHNFAWREQWDGRELIVHRKGATPAAAGVLGVIPGSMASPGYVVRGRGNPESLNSASHGAGRCMSRKQALRSLSWDRVQRVLRERGVRLLAGGLDEAPMAYKDIDKVMEAQRDLVTPLARFEPRLVLMAP